MAHRDRKTVHETANRLGLKSQSSGAGHGRFPVLYKTERTRELDGIALDKIEAFLGPRKSGLRKCRAAQGSVVPTSRNRGGDASAGVSYRDGEVVGAAAPEIGHENKGRAMLERMGWSNGTALGASNNKGMLQPVSHTVKTTKAGLG